MNKADLHVHSKFSNDGELCVKDIFDKCGINGIETLSITDHNSVKGIIVANANCLNQGIDFIPGIEIDCVYKGVDLHLLGYIIDWKSSDFLDLEESVIEKGMDALPEMIDNLYKVGIEITENEVMAQAKGQLPCGEHIAEVLLFNNDYHSNKKLLPYLPGGDRSDMPLINFYHDYFAQGKPAYVKMEYMDFNDSISLIKDNGGIPIVAHPGINFINKEELLPELFDKGVEGLEVFNNYHNDEQSSYFAQLVVQGNYLMTGGSDFHGKTKPLIGLGEYKIDARYNDYNRKSILKISSHQQR